MRKLFLVVVAAGAALGLAAGAWAGGGYGGYGDGTTSTQSASSTSGASSETYSFKATLTAGQEVPKPTAPEMAAGTFTAKSTESGSTTTFHWVLRFHGLSGKAMAAHVHMGKKGTAGAVVVPLCGPCKNGQSGTVKIKSSVETALEKGTTYVNVHTAKNPNGEIRGQIKLTGK